jgi:altronate dehydratase large subunit
VSAPELRGWRRRSGWWGVRNHVLVLPAHGAANLAAQRIAMGLSGVRSVAHQWESPGDDPDRERVLRTLAGFGANPNLAATLVLGITAEDHELAGRIAATGAEVEFMAMADHRGTAGTVEAGRPLALALAENASRLAPEPMPISALMLGLECGGSDALSGITANPALGVASDLLVGLGGTSILAETTELIGAEHLLARRAASPEVARRIIEVIHRFELAILELGVDVRGAQPAPGNIEGGLTTIEEKSLGAAKKGGDAAVAGVVEFAERPAGTGLYIMDTPGHDIEQMTGMVAGGCQVAVFTTGRGTPTGCAIAPVIKVATNTPIFLRMRNDIDLDAGAIIAGSETLHSMGEKIFTEIFAVANGKQTSAERRGNHEFAISRTTYAMPALGS